MRQHLSGVDHCFMLVRSLERARRLYTQLGFTVSPLGRHSANRGTGNHTIMLEHGYFELLGVLEQTPLSEKWLDALEKGEGLSSIALATDDADAAVEELRASGFKAQDAASFSRPVSLPDGTYADARFRTARFPEGTAPHVGLFCCRHETPEYVWLAPLLNHANSAYGIDCVIVTSDLPGQDAQQLATVLDSATEELSDDAFYVDTGDQPVLYMTRNALSQRYGGVDVSSLPRQGPAALSVKVHSVAMAAACLRDAGVPYLTTRAGLVIAPQEACGVLLAFRST
ncbi:VOC family protein [Paraburkholderia heleia]|uniref:VOC family protein n=1 Tax=Paraburkholderia heleia TaxID=634127 RepID=UPI0031D42FE8